MVHHLERRRHHAARDDRRHGRGAVLDALEVEQHRAHCGCDRGQAHARGRDDAEGSLRADDEAPQVVPGRRRRLRADARRRAVGQHEVERQHVRARHAVGQAMRSAGVRVDVAADRADLLRGGIGRVRESGRRERGCEIEVEDAGLDPRQAVFRAHLEDPVHLGGDDDERVADRRGAAGKAGAAAARDHRQVVVGRDAHARGHVLGAPREHDEPGRALRRARRRARRAERERVGEHRVGAERGLEVAAGAADRSRTPEDRLRRLSRESRKARVCRAALLGAPCGASGSRPGASIRRGRRAGAGVGQQEPHERALERLVVVRDGDERAVGAPSRNRTVHCSRSVGGSHAASCSLGRRFQIGRFGASSVRLADSGSRHQVESLPIGASAAPIFRR